MDELEALGRRLLGSGEPVTGLANEARRAPERPEQIIAVLAGVRAARRSRDTDHPPVAPAAGGDGDSDGLRAAVARELAAATARLPPRQQEALALRELLGLSHALVAQTLEIEPAATAALLARARLRLRVELRGAGAATADCLERDRALRTSTLRQDGEPVSEADGDWLMEHVGHCDACLMAHAAMLEASVCYRGWPGPDALASERSGARRATDTGIARS